MLTGLKFQYSVFKNHLVVVSPQHFTLTERVCVYMFVPECGLYASCCAHLLTESPIGSEKLGQWADENWDAAGRETLRRCCRLCLAGLFKPIGRMSVAILMCWVQPWILIEGEKKTKNKNLTRLSLLLSSFATSGYAGNCSPGKLQSEELGGAEKRGREHSLGKAKILLWFR